MQVRRLLPQKATVQRITQDGPVDDMGDPTEVVTPTGPFRCYAWQTRSSDETANTDIQDQEWRLVLERKANGQIAGSDRVEIDDIPGVTFEVDGPPWPARNPRTRRLELIECRLRTAG